MQDLQDDLRFIFEPLVAEILQKKPDNVQEYMIKWLIKNRKNLRENNVIRELESSEEDDEGEEEDEE